MALRICSKGHFYDDEFVSECPTCNPGVYPVNHEALPKLIYGGPPPGPKAPKQDMHRELRARQTEITEKLPDLNKCKKSSEQEGRKL